MKLTRKLPRRIESTTLVLPLQMSIQLIKQGERKGRWLGYQEGWKDRGEYESVGNYAWEEAEINAYYKRTKT